MKTQPQDVMTLQDLLDRKEWGKALTVLDQQVQREPDQRQWRLVRASVLIKSGRVNEGIEGLTSLTGLFPDFLDAWINLGQTHKALGNYLAADAAYREAMKLQPEHPIATKGAAQCA